MRWQWMFVICVSSGRCRPEIFKNYTTDPQSSLPDAIAGGESRDGFGQRCALRMSFSTSPSLNSPSTEPKQVLSVLRRRHPESRQNLIEPGRGKSARRRLQIV